MTDIRKKIERELSIKDYYEHDNRIYFKTRSGYIVSLSKNYYFQRLHELQDYFKDREPNEAKRLIQENLAISAIPLQMKDYPVPKIEIFRDSCWATTIKVSGYAEGDPTWDNPDKDIMFKRSLTDARGNVLNDVEQEAWNSAREREDPRIMELCREVLRRLREGLKI